MLMISMKASLTCKISESADNMKITSRVITTAEKIELQSNVDILVSWSEKWQMKFIVDKCKVLHLSETKINVQNIK